MNHSGLSSRELGLLSEWELNGVDHVKPRDLAERVGVEAARKVLARLAGKGALDRIGRGLYTVKPLRAVGRPWASPAAATAARMLAGRCYYIGGPLALTLRRLTTQVNYAVVDVFMPDQWRPREIGNARIVFHTLRWGGAFDFGIAPIELDGISVEVSDLERTLLDALDRPELIGGPGAALELFRGHLDRVDVDRLIGYALRWGRDSLRQRAGFLLEAAGAPAPQLGRLAAGMRPTNPVPLRKGGSPRGPAHPVWRVVVDARDVEA
jgi:predicted transcriptional regulator of viral defense system